MATRSRRKHARTKARNLMAHFRVGDHNVMAPIDDISLGGALIATHEMLAQGMILSIDVARPGLKRPLRLQGRVVERWPGRGVRLRFEGLDPDTHDRLTALVLDLGAVTTRGSAEGDPVELPPAPVQRSAIEQPAPKADDSQRLMIQLRGAIMEIGELQQQLVQRDRDLHDARERLAAAQPATADLALARREVEAAAAALVRLADVLRRMGA